jgi:hypothetical protein
VCYAPALRATGVDEALSDKRRVPQSMAVGTSRLFWGGCSCGMPLRPRVVLARARLVSCPFRSGRRAADRGGTVLGGGASRSLLAGDRKRRRAATIRLSLSLQRTYARVARGTR